MGRHLPRRIVKLRLDEQGIAKQRLTKQRLVKPIFVIAYLLIALLFAVAVYALQSLEYLSWIKYFSILVICQFFFQFIILKQVNIELLSLSGFFLILSYLFHFGQLLLMGLVPNYEFQRLNFIEVLNPDYIQRTAIYCLLAILILGFGMLISAKKNKAAQVSYNYKETRLNLCKTVGWILILSCFPIQLYLDISKLVISISNGYLSTYQTEISGIWSTLAFFSFTGFTLLMLGFSKQKKKSKLIFLAVIAYLILTMVSGHRGHQLTIIMFLTYLFHKTMYRIDGRKLIVICILCFFGSVLLNTFAVYRNIPNKTFSAFSETFSKNLEINPISELVSEMGGTIQTPYLVMQQIPLIRPYAYGVTYPMSLFSVVPNYRGYFSRFNFYAAYTKNIQGSALGGSYLGELYYNFSYLGVFFAFFIGWGVNRLSQKVESLICQERYFQIGYYAPAFMYCLWWPRDTFQAILRPVIWGGIALYLIARYVTRRGLFKYRPRLGNIKNIGEQGAAIEKKNVDQRQDDDQRVKNMMFKEKVLLFTVIIPVYNVERYLKQCVNSVLTQGYLDIEVILVNDGSTDGSGAICDDYAASDRRVKAIHQENGGLSEARNMGISVSKGVYLLFLDGDDYWLKGFLRELDNVIEDNNQPELVFGDAICNFFPRGEIIEECCGFQASELNLLGGEAALDYIFSKTTLNAWSAWRSAYRSDLLKRQQLFFQKGIVCEDAEWTPRVILKATTLALYEKPFYMYRHSRPDSIMNTCSEKKLRDYWHVVKGWLDYANRMENQKLAALIRSKFCNDFVQYFRYIYFFDKEFRQAMISELEKSQLLDYLTAPAALEIKKLLEQKGYHSVLKQLNRRHRTRQWIKQIAVNLRLIDR